MMLYKNLKPVRYVIFNLTNDKKRQNQRFIVNHSKKKTKDFKVVFTAKGKTIFENILAKALISGTQIGTPCAY